MDVAAVTANHHVNRRPLKGINGTREMPVHETVLFSKHLNAYYHNEVARSLMTLVMYEIVFCHFVLFSWSAPEQLPPGPSLQRKRHRLFSLSLRQSAEGGALGLVRDRNLSQASDMRSSSWSPQKSLITVSHVKLYLTLT